MGGCRCTYRNCQTSTGGGLHFFHYPVFDKVRCHQWIANGRRYDLLDLKLSQLRNRVVCQRHFRDEMFMNYKKDRLTCSAVPTEDGPVLFEEPPEQTHVSKNTTLNDQVKDDRISDQDDTKYYTVREKAATLSVPYKVFLEKSGLESLNDPELRKSLPSPKSKTILSNRWVRPKIKTTMIGRLVRPKVFQSARKKIKNNNSDGALPPVKQKIQQIQNKSSNTANNVVIISEQKLSPPLPIVPIPTVKASSSFVINKPKKTQSTKNTKNTSSSDTIVENSGQQPECTNYILLPEQPGALEGVLQPVACDPLAIDDFCPPTLPLPVTAAQAVDDTITVCPPNIPAITETIPDKVAANKNLTVAKNTVRALRKGWLNKSNIKVSAEKLAEINKKRKFNMSIKEVVERTLQGVNNPVPAPAAAPSPTLAPAPTTQSKHLDNSDTRAGSKEAHATHEVLSGVSSTLLSAVEENKRDIAEIKRILLGRPNIASMPSTKVDRQTNTNWSEDSKKKYLFREISQYLSSSLKSSVYEELFLSIGSSKRQKVKK